MNGRRVYPTQRIDGSWPRLAPGEYGLLWGEWHACTPNGHGCNLSAHEVTEHPDRTITVLPSIRCETSIDGKSVEVWHGFLERGVWRSA